MEVSSVFRNVNFCKLHLQAAQNRLYDTMRKLKMSM